MISGSSTSKFAIYAFVIIFCAIGFGLVCGAILKFGEGEVTSGFLLLVAGLAFGGFGLGVYALIAAGFKMQARELELQQMHPAAPWMWREDWASGRVRRTERSAAWFFWGFAILWNLISTPLVIFLPEEVIEKENTPALIGLIFPLVGIGLLIFAIRKTIQHRKFGDCVFQMAHVPGVLGGDVAGTLLVPHGITIPAHRLYWSGSVSLLCHMKSSIKSNAH